MTTMAKPDTTLAQIAAQFTRHDVEKSGSGYLILDRNSQRPLARLRPIPDTDRLARSYQPANRQANEEALRLFYAAIELDPDFASAYGLAASCYVDVKYQAWIAGTPDEIVEVSRLVRRAVELGKDDAIAIAAGGWALAYVARDLDTGGALIDRALLLNSNFAEAWSFGGWVKLWLGEPEAAIERFARAIRLSPLDAAAIGMRTGIAHGHFFLSRY